MVGRRSRVRELVPLYRWASWQLALRVADVEQRWLVADGGSAQICRELVPRYERSLVHSTDLVD